MAILHATEMYSTLYSNEELGMSAVKGEKKRYETLWRAWGEKEGFPMREPGEDCREIAEGGKEVVAHVSDGRWVALCPHCNSGFALLKGHLKACCLKCGLVWEVKWPRSVDGVERELLLRCPINRHFLPQQGDTVASLREENKLHAGELLAVADTNLRKR